MFSSFKERLNTSLSKGLATTTTTASITTTPKAASSSIPETDTNEDLNDDSGSLNSLASPHSPTPSITSTPTSLQEGSKGTTGGTGGTGGAGATGTTTSTFVSFASRITKSSASSSAYFFRRPLASSTATTATATTTTAATKTSSRSAIELGSSSSVDDSIRGSKLADLVQKLTLDPKHEKPDPSELDRIREEYQKQQRQAQALADTRDQQALQSLFKLEEGDDQESEHVQRRQHEQQSNQEPAGTELSEAVIERLEMLQRYEARFPGEKTNNLGSSHSTTIRHGKKMGKKRKKKDMESILLDLADAFKKIVQEKIAAEAVLKATTPLEDLGDIEALKEHLQNMTHKNEMSMQEIRRLAEELRDANKAKETETASQAGLIDELRAQLVSLQEEIDRLRSKDTISDTFSDTTSILHQTITERYSDAETKVNSLDLALRNNTPSPSPSSESFLQETMLDPDDNPMAPPTMALAPKDKRSKRDPQKKDQALRELMIRLESVLKEKNRAQEEQEEALEEIKQLRSSLEKEVRANKEMAEKMDQLQGKMAEMEERVHRQAGTITATGSRISSGATVHQDPEPDQSDPKSSPSSADEAASNPGSEDSEDDSPQMLILQEELSTLRLELETSAVRSSEASQANQRLTSALSELQHTHATLQENLTRTTQDLESANLRIKDFEEVAFALGEARQDLSEAREEVQEKQRLLDLERQWREEADQNREAMKRECESLRGRRAELERQLQELMQSESRVLELQGKVHALEQQLAETTAVSTTTITATVAETTNASEAEQFLVLSEKIGQHERAAEEQLRSIETLRSEKAALEATAGDQRTALETLRAEHDKVTETLTLLQQQEQARFLRVQELETELVFIKGLHYQHQYYPPGERSSRSGTNTPTTPTRDDEFSMIKASQRELELNEPRSESDHQPLKRVPSMNALTKLRQELNRVKKAKEDADATISVLQSELEAARLKAATTAAATNSDSIAATEKDSDTMNLAELSALKQERAVLSEKLARLERLHQGFELSSSEKIQSLERELSVLLGQKAALEARVKEQSDLLIIKEKGLEGEQELEQARVVEGIERVKLELAAVRTAERFASEKVTELAKDRDMVAEKVVKLEKRLESLRESKDGQEQSLTGRIEELELEKQKLEKQIESMKAELETLRTQSDQENKELSAKLYALTQEHDQALNKISQLESELEDLTVKVSEANRTQDLEEQLAALQAELREKTKELEIAQSQAQTQHTLHTEKVTQLMDEIQALKLERDSSVQPKQELELQLLEATEQAVALRQQLKVLEEDNERLMNTKAESQEKMSELQSKINTLGLKEREHNEALSLAKDTIHQRDQDLSVSRKLLQETEANLEKTNQKLSKIESEKQALADEVGPIKVSLTKAQQEVKSIMAKSTGQQSAVAQELQRLKATHVKILQERDRLTQERDNLLQEKETHQQEAQTKHAELETLQQMHESAESQLREYQTQLTEARNRVDTLEELTSIAKRVAETKVAEFESLTARSTELEAELAKAKDGLRKQEETHSEVLRKLRADIKETRSTLGEEVSGLMEQLEQRDETIRELKAREQASENEVEEMKRLMDENSRAIETLETEALELKNRKRDLELELQHFKDLEEILAKEKAAHEAAAEEFKMREGHLRTMNKTLKEEVRKLQKQAPTSPLPSPSRPHSPYSQGNMPQSPGGPSGSSSTNNSNNTPSTHQSMTSAQGGRAFSTPVLNLTPPTTPRFQRQQPSPDEDVNVEYLKNVLLNFMEHKDRRHQLIPVMAQMLKLTSDEAKRFAKVI
ncbi:hypothetical protein BGX34_005726 [Mortierella sp. NVP85]|nr:hypothetical protein BGX34_005726 [Mortierella sp. NVP85]